MTTTGAVKSVDSVLVECDVPMVTRDGTVLRSNVYRPSGDGPWPVLLTRLPYGKDNPPELGAHASLIDPMAAARRGYIVVVQDVRGTNASDGEFRPFRNEYTDGADTVSWAAGLSGSSGVVGMYGCSYFGHTQFAAAVEGEEALRALIPRLRCADPLNGMYFRHGAFELTMQVSWYLKMALGEAVRQYAGEPDNLLEVVRELVASTDALGLSRPASRASADPLDLSPRASRASADALDRTARRFKASRTSFSNAPRSFPGAASSGPTRGSCGLRLASTTSASCSPSPGARTTSELPCRPSSAPRSSRPCRSPPVSSARCICAPDAGLTDASQSSSVVKATTSAIEVVPQARATRRSRPRALPPLGGTRASASRNRSSTG